MIKTKKTIKKKDDKNKKNDKNKKDDKNKKNDKKEKEKEKEKDKIENENDKKNKKQLKDKIFVFNEEDEEKEIDQTTLLSYVRKNFGLSKEEVQLTPKQKMKIKLFYVAYISNELINDICNKLHQKGFEYKSICDFYYNVSCLYNAAIEGFNELKYELIEEKENLTNYSDLKNEGIGNTPTTVIFGKNKD